MKRFVARGFTLIELLVVVAILAALTALVVLKFDGMQAKANHGIGAASANDTGRVIQTYKVTHNKYPNGWDSLIDTASSGLWTAPSLDKAGLNSGLTGALDPAKAKLSTTVLSAGQVSSLQRSGIVTVYNLTSASTAIPGDRFSTAETVSTSTRVATINNTTAPGMKIVDTIYPANLRTGGTSGALPANKTLMVFGFGPNNELIGTSMTEVPFYPNADPTLVYHRNLVVFEVDGNGGRADLKAVLAADGDLQRDMVNDFFK